MTRPAARAGQAGPLVAVALGGAIGALLRWTLGELVPDGAGLPGTTFAINVSGSFALAWLPALGVVRGSPVLTAGMGPGLLGGYTTLSAYAVQARALLADDRAALGVAYLVGTLAACLLAVAGADRLSSQADRRSFRRLGGEE